jgi:hypothetical protein
MADLLHLAKEMYKHPKEFAKRYKEIVNLEFLCVPKESDCYTKRDELQKKQVLLKTSIDTIENEKKDKIKLMKK